MVELSDSLIWRNAKFQLIQRAFSSDPCNPLVSGTRFFVGKYYDIIFFLIILMLDLPFDLFAPEAFRLSNKYMEIP